MNDVLESSQEALEDFSAIDLLIWLGNRDINRSDRRSGLPAADLTAVFSGDFLEEPVDEPIKCPGSTSESSSTSRETNEECTTGIGGSTEGA